MTRRTDETRRLLLHLHVPKCAGTSVNHALRARFGPRALHAVPVAALREKIKAIPEAERAGALDAVMGHFLWGIHNLFPDRRFQYVSIVRDPVARVCSYFNFVHNHPEHDSHRFLRGVIRDMKDLDEDTFEALRGMRSEWCNRMVRAYVGQNALERWPWERVWHRLSVRLDRSLLVAGDVATVERHLRAEGYIKGPLPRANTFESQRVSDFTPAHPSTIGTRATDLLRRHNDYDLRFLDHLAAWREASETRSVGER